MFCFTRPDECRLGRYLAAQAEQSFSYDQLGCTQELATSEALAGWTVDRQRVLLGQGAEVFQRARAAIQGWRMFPPAITRVLACDTQRAGLDVVVLFDAWPVPLRLLMPARVVYIIDDSVMRGQERVDRFGFAYGTLPDHPERGEERFLVEWNRDEGSVHYDLLAVSQPRHWVVRLAYPYTRWQQARFRRLSGREMQRAVALTT